MSRTSRKMLAALLIGVAAAATVFTFLPKTSGDPVVTVSQLLTPGTVIEASHVTTKVYPKDLIPSNAVRDVKDVVGKTSASTLEPGMPVTATALVENAPSTVPPGYVRVPVSLADQAASSVLQPGHHVQVFSTVSDAAGVLVDDATVVTVSTSKDPFAGETRVVTLAVKQDDTPKLAGGTGLGFALLGSN